MNAEPLTSEQLAEIEEFAQAVTVAWGQRTPDLSDFLSTAAGHGARIAREYVPLLAAEIGWLAAELADEQATHAKTVDNFEIFSEAAEDDRADLAALRLMFGRLQANATAAVAEAGRLRAVLREIAGFCRKERCEGSPQDCPSELARQALRDGAE